MDLHESPVTCIQYYADCPSELITEFYSAGASSLNRKKQAYSQKVSSDYQTFFFVAATHLLFPSLRKEKAWNNPVLIHDQNTELRISNELL